MAREATVAGALAMNDLSMSMWLIELSVSSCTPLSPTTVTFSIKDGVSSSFSSSVIGDRTSIER